MFAGLLATALENAGIQATVIGCDDYYREHWTPDPLFGFDTVEAIDADNLIDDLNALRSGQLKQRRRYDMGTRAVHWTPLDEGCDVILLEGAYGPQLLLKSSPPELLIYLEESLAVRALRRLRRDTRERQRTVASVLRQMLRQMIPGERRFIKPLKEAADVVVTRTDRGLAEAVVSIIDLCSSQETH
ncbi:uridine kinase [Synechococcus sp. PROS-7-1]|nr:uridine kinase [Synechococcus sp. PROS-7-1]